MKLDTRDCLLPYSVWDRQKVPFIPIVNEVDSCMELSDEECFSFLFKIILLNRKSSNNYFCYDLIFNIIFFLSKVAAFLAFSSSYYSNFRACYLQGMDQSSTFAF